MTNPNPRFTGIFIPVEILEMGLTSTECMLLAWIDALYCKNHGGCYASNEHFCKTLHLKDNTVKILISKLVDLGLVERVSFNGRQRVIRACKEKWFEQRSQSTPDVDYNQPQTLNKINPCGLSKSTPPIIYKEKLREKNKHIEKKPSAVCVSPSFLSFGTHVKLKQEDYDSLCDEYGKKTIDDLIIEMNDYISSTGKIYKCFASTLRNWLKKNKSKQIEQPKKYTAQENKEHFEKNILNNFWTEHYEFEVFPRGVECKPRKGNGPVDVIDYSDNQFRFKIQNLITRKEFKNLIFLKAWKKSDIETYKKQMKEKS